MEIFSLAGNSSESRLGTDLDPYAVYKRSLVRVDQTDRDGSRDLVSHTIRKYFRAFQLFVRHNGIRREARELYTSASTLESSLGQSSQNPAGLAEITNCRCVG